MPDFALRIIRVLSGLSLFHWTFVTLPTIVVTMFTVAQELPIGVVLTAAIVAFAASLFIAEKLDAWVGEAWHVRNWFHPVLCETKCDSPLLAAGWILAEGPEPDEEMIDADDANGQQAVRLRPKDGDRYKLDYRIELTDVGRIEFVGKFNLQDLPFVKLQMRDQQGKMRFGWLHLERKTPTPTRKEEDTFAIGFKEKRLKNGWGKLSVTVTELFPLTFSGDGYTLIAVCGYRIYGEITLARIVARG